MKDKTIYLTALWLLMVTINIFTGAVSWWIMLAPLYVSFIIWLSLNSRADDDDIGPM